MLEPEHCRPKVSLPRSDPHIILWTQLYHTLNDLLGRAGEEDPFPESDNASKLKRSCENAEHVGKSPYVSFTTSIEIGRPLRTHRWRSTET